MRLTQVLLKECDISSFGFRGSNPLLFLTGVVAKWTTATDQGSVPSGSQVRILSTLFIIPRSTVVSMQRCHRCDLGSIPSEEVIFLEKLQRVDVSELFSVAPDKVFYTKMVASCKGPLVRFQPSPFTIALVAPIGRAADR